MKRRRKISLFKKWKDKFQKIKLKQDRLAFLALIMGGILAMSFLVFYFRSLIEKERLWIRKELEGILLQETGPISAERSEPTSQETLFSLRETGVERYFLSEVELIDARYTPIVHTCLFAEEEPIYPLYVYETWSMLDYPELKPEIALMRYLLLPEDDPDFQPDKNCFIKEIKTEKDWQELEEKYGFSKSRF